MSWSGIAAAVAAGVAIAASSLRYDGFAHYNGGGVSFDFPAAWGYVQEGTTARALHYQPIVFMSTQQLRDPCAAGGCAGPLVAPLRPGGVLVEWARPWRAPRVHWRPTTRIAGEPAVVSIRRRGSIETVYALFPRRGISMTATLRGPGLRLHERAVRLMLQSAV